MGSRCANCLSKTALIGVLFLCMPLVCFGGDPTADLREFMDTAIEILKDPAYQAPEHQAEQRAKMWAVVKQAFDFNEISKRALSREWRRFTPDERVAFSAVFAELLGNTYLRRIQGEFQNEEVIYDGQQLSKEKPLARVNTRILRPGTAVPVSYSMHLQDGRWWVYDVKIEGVSLVKNYRTQFRKILLKDSPAQLIERLRTKVADIEDRMQPPKAIQS